MEEKSNEELEERIEILTKKLEEDAQEGGAGQRERERWEILQAMKAHRKRLGDLSRMDAEWEEAHKEFLSIEEELGKRRRINEKLLDKEEEMIAELQRRSRMRKYELRNGKEKEEARNRRISGDWGEEEVAGSSHQQQEQRQAFQLLEYQWREG